MKQECQEQGQKIRFRIGCVYTVFHTDRHRREIVNYVCMMMMMMMIIKIIIYHALNLLILIKCTIILSSVFFYIQIIKYFQILYHLKLKICPFVV
jgi:hypothetical protein